MRFSHDTAAQRVVLDTGGFVDRVAAEVDRLGASRVMVVAGGSAAAYAEMLADRLPVALTWREVAQHVPVELAERTRVAAGEAGADLLVCVGGGSAIGLAKAVALTSGLRIVAVPTTYAGSEATAVWGLTEDRHKTTGVDPRVLPTTVVYDADLTLDLPAELSVSSGLNALAHAVEALWAPGADPVNAALALEGARALSRGLPAVAAEPRGIEGREDCLYGAHLAAVAFASAGSGLHHKTCHVLGGTFGLPHAATHAIVLPHVLAFNAPAVPAAGRLAEALGGSGDPTTALVSLAALLAAPRALRDLGLAEEDLPEAVDRVLAVVPPSNPRAVTRPALEALLHAAWAGAEPEEQR